MFRIFHKKRTAKGFTLIELLSSIFIIAMLASIMVPNMRRAVLQARLTSCQGNLRTVAASLQMYTVDSNSQLFPNQLSELQPKYLVKIPTCPSAGSDTYSPGYATTADNQTYSITCKGTNHNPLVGEDEPFYNELRGLGP